MFDDPSDAGSQVADEDDDEDIDSLLVSPSLFVLLID